MRWDKKFIKNLTLVIVGVVLYWGLSNLHYIHVHFDKLMAILSPVAIGFLLALILNVPMSAIERNLFRPDKNNNYGKVKGAIKRPVSLLITMALCIGVIVLALSLLIPELINTFSQMSTQVPQLAGRITKAINKSKLLSEWLSDLDVSTETLTKKIQKLLNDGELVLSTARSTFSFASTMLSGLINFIIGVFFAIYMLLQKENLKRQVYRVTTAFVNEKTAKRLCYVCNLSKETFSKFIAGQSIEACILGSLCCGGMLIFGFPNALTVGVLVAVTAFIPILGAVVGAVVGAFFIMFTSITKALWFLVFIVVLQQTENNLIYPKVVGKSVGLPSLWVLFAITVGGAVSGVVGMFVSVPVCSVVYCLTRELVNHMHERRGDLPAASEEEVAEGEQ